MDVVVHIVLFQHMQVQDNIKFGTCLYFPAILGYQALLYNGICVTRRSSKFVLNSLMSDIHAQRQTNLNTRIHLY